MALSLYHSFYGRCRKMGLGVLSDISLKQACEITPFSYKFSDNRLERSAAFL
ncbi:hypothetical protein GGR08_001011 [Bartonella fuyuanensis]|uniref:Uncharacterized protein n=1 Tax=Bartonella fuyuanensis TaxID=1460968 RepID=A0A840DYW4_9HYPH|nr:hypothetical protein [Bartonella fuyuanensis]